MPRADEAVILAGGFGTRLQSIVKDVPKPLAPVAGRPFIAYLLDLLANQGISKVILATGHLADVVERVLGDTWRGMTLTYSVETVPLGTGGALAMAQRHLSGDAFFVLNGDTYLDLDYSLFDAFASKQEGGICVALADVSDVSRYGAVRTSGVRVTGFSEKGEAGPGQINAGVYRLSRDLVRTFPDTNSFSFERAVLVPNAAVGAVSMYSQTKGFIDIGVPEDYERAQDIFRRLGS